ncbi:hypothetical protein TeGR_g1140 [Tetraparma gracilis]|uniref:Uncharacterized protein n=1 Tax=Tetraparma gracilis TaxID=2962635 RepID=A0ABQ6NBJ2_9STRA|nr:hypothetical protein TeGR_g1140 [Tetraparma gracilis]
MADSSAVLAAARSAQNPKKKVMKGPEIDLDMDALMAGVLGEGDDKKKKKQKEEDDGEEKMHGTASVDAAAKARAHARENVVDELLTEYAAEPHTKVKMKKKKVRRYPCYNFRKIIGCAHVDLHTCVLEGKLGRCRRTLRRLGKKHAERINEHDVRGRTALSLAVKESREDIADLILSSTDSDPDLRDKWTGMAPLHHAAHLGLTNTVSKIIWRQGDINITDNNGTTPLMMACAIGNERMVNMLLEENADPEKRDNYHWNSLFYAAYGGSVKVTEKILNQGINKRLKDKKKMIAQDWSDFCGHGEVSALLENFQISMSTDKYKGAMG